MIIIFSFINKCVISMKRWISTTFISGWENLSNQITLLLALTTGTGGLTQYDHAITPLEFDYFYSQSYATAHGIDFTNPKVANTITSLNNPSFQNATDYWYIEAKLANYYNPYLYLNGALVEESLNYLIPRNRFWNQCEIEKFYPNLTSLENAKDEMLNNWNTCNIAYFGTSLYLQVYDLVYILDANYDVTAIKKLVLPVKYFFDDGTDLWFCTTGKMVARCK